MEYGLSLVQASQLIHARDADYQSCEHLQIVCPACHEPLHKRGSAITQREYFAHFKAKAGAECDLRVLAIVQEQLNPRITLPQGQDLSTFLRRFQDIIMERSQLRIRLAERHETIAHIIGHMSRRLTYRHLLVTSRQHLMAFYLDGGRNKAQVAAGMAEAWDVQERAFLDHVIAYLTSANSYQAYQFAISHGLLQIIASTAHMLEHNLPMPGVTMQTVLNTMPLLRFLVEASEPQLKRELARLQSNSKTIEGLFAAAMTNTASRFMQAVMESESPNPTK